MITTPDALRPDIRAEIDRVLAPGASVYLLGGPVALSADVESAVKDAGYRAVRLSGETRYDTAIEIAEELGNPDLALVATGESFADALSASAAAGANDGAVLLTTNDTPHPSTVAYLDRVSPDRVVAIGGPASRAFPDAEQIIGSTRFATAVDVADLFFDSLSVAGLARGDRFPDALAGAAHVGRLGGPMLLTPTGALDPDVADLLCDQRMTLDLLYVYSGPVAIDDAVRLDALGAIDDASSC